MVRNTCLSVLALLLVASATRSALAQTDMRVADRDGARRAPLTSALLGAPEANESEKSESSDKGSDAQTGDEKATTSTSEKGKATTAPEVDTDQAYIEEEGTTTRWLGIRSRVAVIPQFMFNLFQADGGKTVVSPSVGPELAVRRNGFEYDVWLTYASYSMGNTPFKSNSDPDVAYEIVRSSIKTLSIGSDFLWSKELNPRFSVVYGLGAGVGVVFGNLERTQAYPPSGVRDPYQYLPCPGPTGGYCANDNEHYNGYKEPSWINGGSKPVLFPWIAPFQIGMRWKAHPKVVLRMDMGLSFPGPFFFGLAGQYGLF